MPELPEVEITRRRIADVMVERTICSVRTTADSYFFLTRPATLRRRLRGRRVAALRRRGKYLVAELDDGARLLLHLGMTGQLFSAGVSSARLLVATARGALTPEQQLQPFRPDAHTHLQLAFLDGGADVLFRDVRKFGKVQLLGEREACERLDRLGPDALGVDGRYLHRAARGRRVAIKTLLLDQAVLAGVGNIYADEALFAAGIHPSNAAGSLSPRRCDRLVQALHTVLARAIETGGSSVSDYIAPDGRDGSYQDERHVYARAGLPCHVCGRPVERRAVGQRSTCFCPRCQR